MLPLIEVRFWKINSRRTSADLQIRCGMKLKSIQADNKGEVNRSREESNRLSIHYNRFSTHFAISKVSQLYINHN